MVEIFKFSEKNTLILIYNGSLDKQTLDIVLQAFDIAIREFKGEVNVISSWSNARLTDVSLIYPLAHYMTEHDCEFGKLYNHGFKGFIKLMYKTYLTLIPKKEKYFLIDEKLYAFCLNNGTPIPKQFTDYS